MIRIYIEIIMVQLKMCQLSLLEIGVGNKGGTSSRNRVKIKIGNIGVMYIVGCSDESTVQDNVKVDSGIIQKEAAKWVSYYTM